jgi:hypothetical protein
MARRIILDGQSWSVLAHQWDGDQVWFMGTSPATAPTVTFNGPNTLGGVVDGQAANAAFGTIRIASGVNLAIGGIALNHGTLAVNDTAGATLTLTGASTLANRSTLNVFGVGTVTLNGTMSIDGTSTANLDYMSVSGQGQFHLTGEDALLRLGTVGAGETVVLDGGVLSLSSGMRFLGTITDSSPSAGAVSPFAEVDIYNAMDAVSETFNTATGALALFNAAGTEVAGLHFAGTGPVFAVKTSGLPTDHIVLSMHPAANALPIALSS